MRYTLSLVLAVLPFLASAAPLPESGPNRTLTIRNPLGGTDIFTYSHTVRRDPDHSADHTSYSAHTPHMNDGYNAGKTHGDELDHKLAHDLSDPIFPTAASYPAKAVLDGTSHKADGEVLSPEEGKKDGGEGGMEAKGKAEQKDEEMKEGDHEVTIGMDGGHAEVGKDGEEEKERK